MQFKHPEILYALFLLIIPILIHLFQLRRFQRVEFTNVKLLKTIKLQTRKSSQLKKWLILFIRMLLISFVIITFAQPFIPNSEDFNEAQETVIYLDNSFSMQAKGKNGTLLNEAIQDIINTLPEDEKISLFTNTKTYKNTTIKAIKNDLIQLAFSYKQLSYDAAYLKGKQLFNSTKNATKNLVLVSDFQQKKKLLNFETDSTIQLRLVQPKTNLTSNISIDSLYISNVAAETLELNVILSNSSNTVKNSSIALFSNDTLLAKRTIDITNNVETIFTLPNNKIINGKLQINDTQLDYDNTFYFNINAKPKIKVLAINENTKDAFLRRIYTNDEFDFKSFKSNALNFNLIPDQNLIVLNELNEISNALKAVLDIYVNDGGSILVIPSEMIDIASYNHFFLGVNTPIFNTINANEKRIVTINYDHRLLTETFYRKVKNFQYPKVKASYPFSSTTGSVLAYDNGFPFLIGKSNIYVFSSALNTNNSNFKNSPLVVPVLYNIGMQSLKLSKLYYTIGKSNTIAISTVLEQDDILTLNSIESSMIPLQKIYSKLVVIETDEIPDLAGIFNVKNKDITLQNLSFNYNRNESNLRYYDLSKIKNVFVDFNLTNAISTIKSNTTINALWKWFAIFALIFLIIELLILKYLK